MVAAACHLHGDHLVHIVIESLTKSASIRLDSTPCGVFLKIYKQRRQKHRSSSHSATHADTMSTSASDRSVDFLPLSRTTLLRHRGCLPELSASRATELRTIPVKNTFIHFTDDIHAHIPHASSDPEPMCQSGRIGAATPPGLNTASTKDGFAEFFAIGESTKDSPAQTDLSMSMTDIASLHTCVYKQVDGLTVADAALKVQRCFRGWRGRRDAKSVRTTAHILAALKDLKSSMDLMNEKTRINIMNLSLGAT